MKFTSKSTIRQFLLHATAKLTFLFMYWRPAEFDLSSGVKYVYMSVCCIISALFLSSDITVNNILNQLMLFHIWASNCKDIYNRDYFTVESMTFL